MAETLGTILKEQIDKQEREKEPYTVFHLNETDGDVTYCTGTIEQLREYIKDMELYEDECRFVKGGVIRNPLA